MVSLQSRSRSRARRPPCVADPRRVQCGGAAQAGVPVGGKACTGSAMGLGSDSGSDEPESHRWEHGSEHGHTSVLRLRDLGCLGLVRAWWHSSPCSRRHLRSLALRVSTGPPAPCLGIRIGCRRGEGHSSTWDMAPPRQVEGPGVLLDRVRWLVWRTNTKIDAAAAPGSHG